MDLAIKYCGRCNRYDTDSFCSVCGKPLSIEHGEFAASFVGALQYEGYDPIHVQNGDAYFTPEEEQLCARVESLGLLVVASRHVNNLAPSLEVVAVAPPLGDMALEASPDVLGAWASQIDSVLPSSKLRVGVFLILPVVTENANVWGEHAASFNSRKRRLIVADLRSGTVVNAPPTPFRPTLRALTRQAAGKITQNTEGRFSWVRAFIQPLEDFWLIARKLIAFRIFSNSIRTRRTSSVDIAKFALASIVISTLLTKALGLEPWELNVITKPVLDETIGVLFYSFGALISAAIYWVAIKLLRKRVGFWNIFAMCFCTTFLVLPLQYLAESLGGDGFRQAVAMPVFLFQISSLAGAINISPWRLFAVTVGLLIVLTLALIVLVEAFPL